MPGLYPRLWRFCVCLTGDRERGGDLAQTTCVRALEKAAHFQVGTHLDRWLFVMARRVWLNEVRRDALRASMSAGDVGAADIVDPKPGVEVNIAALEVLSALMALPEAQRVTAFLVYVEGQRYVDAAGILDIPVGTVMSRLAAARKTINAQLSDTKGVAAQ